MDIRLPNLGDGVSEATVLSVMVSVGDTVSQDDTILELETDKAVAPIPAPEDGKVQEIKVKEGDKVSEGSLVMIFEGDASASSAAGPTPSSTAAPASAPVAAQTPAQLSVTPAPSQTVASYVPQSGEVAPTSPSIRTFAAMFGIDLMRIPGSGRGGRITVDDVRAYVSHIQAAAFQSPPQASSNAVLPTPTGPKALDIDFSKWGTIRKEKVTSLRTKIGEKMSEAWATIPHVTQYDHADITHVMALRKKYNPEYDKKNARITVTVFVLKALASVLKAFPNFNASYDEATSEMIYKEYIHLGVAVDTEAGLIVPVIRDVDKKSVLQLSKELAEVAEKARDRKLGLDDLKGGTFTVSNLGSLGVNAFTPIVNHPEVAILGLSRGVKTPVYNKNGELEPRLLMPLSLSYDHRVIDGADGARFTRAVIDEIEQFDEALLKEK